MSPTRLCAVPLFLAGLLLTAAPGCYATHPSAGGGQIASAPTRHVNPRDIWVPKGYRIEPVIQGLNFPTGVTFDDQGRIYVVEAGYSYGEAWSTPRLLRVIGDGVAHVVCKGDNGPWNGVTYHDGNFYVAEGGQQRGGRILRITPEGDVTTLVDNLPSLGQHHTNGPVIGPDNYLYFGQGTATNSGVVSVDDFTKYGWLKRNPQFHDIPGRDVVLAGVNYETSDPFQKPIRSRWYQRWFPWFFSPDNMKVTGAFVPFGTRTRPGEIIRGQLPCTGAIMRVPLSGGPLELVAWGLRNPYGLAFAPDGTLFATENQYDSNGSRPVWGTGDLLWRIEPGRWYGWPDYYGNERINDANRFGVPHGPTPRLLLAKHPTLPPAPVARFGVHASADGFDFSRNPRFGGVGDAFVAEFGDLAPVTGRVLAPVGYRVARVELEGGIVHPFAVNKGREDAPASLLGTGGFERPIAARFDPEGKALYVVDFGQVLTGPKGMRPVEGTGVLWKITREETR